MKYFHLNLDKYINNIIIFIEKCESNALQREGHSAFANGKYDLISFIYVHYWGSTSVDFAIISIVHVCVCVRLLDLIVKQRKKMFVSDFMMMMKADDWNWTVDSCNCVQVDSVVQCVDVAVAPQEFDSCLPETTDQWKCCCMDYIHEFSRWPWHVH